MLFNLGRRRDESIDYGYLCQMRKELQAFENENRELREKNEILLKKIRVYEPDYEAPKVKTLEEKWQVRPVFQDGELICDFPPKVEETLEEQLLEAYEPVESSKVKYGVNIIVKTDGTIREKEAPSEEPEAISLRSAITPLNISQSKSTEAGG